jgi:hypothetical protein
VTYIRSKMIPGEDGKEYGPYYYLVRTYRDGKTVRTKHVKYLGKFGSKGAAFDHAVSENLIDVGQSEFVDKSDGEWRPRRLKELDTIWREAREESTRITMARTNEEWSALVDELTELMPKRSKAAKARRTAIKAILTERDAPLDAEQAAMNEAMEIFDTYPESTQHKMATFEGGGYAIIKEGASNRRVRGMLSGTE